MTAPNLARPLSQWGRGGRRGQPAGNSIISMGFIGKLADPACFALALVAERAEDLPLLLRA